MRGARRTVGCRSLVVATCRAVAAAALGFGLVSCGGSDEPDEPAETSIDSGLPSAELVQWAGAYSCSTTYAERSPSPFPLVTPTALWPDAGAVIAQLYDYIREEAELTRERAAEVAALGAPPMEGGARLGQHYVDSYETAAQALEELADSIATIGTADPDASTRLAAAVDAPTRLATAVDRFGEISRDLSDAVGNDERLGGRAFSVAFRIAPACDAS